MTTSIQQLFTLGEEFNGKHIRLCDMNGVTHASVIDVINAVTGGSAKVTWSNIKKEHGEVVKRINHFKFPGQGAKPTPVADCETALQIVYHIPGKKAQKFRLAGIWAFLKVLNPDEDFINDLKDRYDRQLQGLMPDRFLLGSTDTKNTRLASRAYDESHLYVRVQLPDDYVNTSNTNPKTMTTSMVKFGIAFSLQDRNLTYFQDPENGYMIYSFQCTSRNEAVLVENILKYNFEGITVLNSREYLDTVRLAEIIGVSPFSPDSYADYLKLAERLFVYIARLVKSIWPDKYLNQHGCSYDIIENVTSNQNAVNAPLEVEVRFRCNNISSELAADMGITDPDSEYLLRKEKAETFRLQKQVIALQSRLGVSSSTETVPPPQVRSRTDGAIIGRDLVTGEEITYDSCEQAAYACEFTPASMRRTYIDKPRQLKGKHWRKADKPYWIPPRGFVYDPDSKESSPNGYVKAVSPDGSEVRVYESTTAAANFINENRRTLCDYIKTGKQFRGLIWSELPFTEWGTWSTEQESTSGETVETAERAVHPTSVQSGANGRCNGKIIARDLATGEEKTYDSVTRAAAFHGMSAHALKENFVDKPRQAKGQHFRSFSAQKYWQPPSYFKYDRTSFEKKTNGYIESVDSEGNKVMYESVAAAVKLEGISRWGIQQYLDTGKPYLERHWKTVKKDDYDTFVQV